MLDEPTNHLSMQAVLWLCHELNTSIWKTSVVIVVSHDRYFIDSTCTDTLHICGVARRLTHSRCDYSTWHRTRGEQQRARQKNIEARAKQCDKLKVYIQSGQAAAGNTSSTSRKLQLKKLEAEAAAEKEALAALDEDEDLPLAMLAGGELKAAAVQLHDAGFAYPCASTLFQHVGRDQQEFMVSSKSRIVLVGENGNGKTTLVKLLMGELEATEGEVIRNRGALFALVNQHHADQIDLKLSPLQFMKSKFPGNNSDAWEETLVKHLRECGVKLDQIHVAASALSGGQRSRVALAAVSFTRPHVLIMDEPTNNLDLSSVEVLAEAIERFAGGVVLVSHDQHFVSRIARETWIVGENAVRRAESFEAYRAELLSKAMPGSDVAKDAVEDHLAKKLDISGGQVSRLLLAKEKERLLS
jgi:ATP-binding cassette subfamily F protein 3